MNSPEAIEDFLLNYSNAKPNVTERKMTPQLRVNTPQGSMGGASSNAYYGNMAGTPVTYQTHAAAAAAQDRTTNGSLQRIHSANAACGSRRNSGTTPMASRQLPPRSPMGGSNNPPLPSFRRNTPPGGGGEIVEGRGGMDSLDKEFRRMSPALPSGGAGGPGSRAGSRPPSVDYSIKGAPPNTMTPLMRPDGGSMGEMMMVRHSQQKSLPQQQQQRPGTGESMISMAGATSTMLAASSGAAVAAPGSPQHGRRSQQQQMQPGGGGSRLGTPTY